MRRRWFVMLLMITLLPVMPVFAEGNLAMTISPSQFIPGNSLHVYFTTPEAGEVSLTVLNAAGAVCATLLNNQSVAAGANDLTWDGMANGQALPAGPYVLHLTMKDWSVKMDVTILSADGSGAAGADALPAQAADTQVPSGETLGDPVPSETENTGGADESASAGNTAAGTTMTPAYQSTHLVNPAHENCYWCTPMDIHDEAAVWAMLTAPTTVIKGDNQREQVILREEPSADSKGIGVVTRVSQSVHVLETRDDGWSLVECYSSSFHDSRVKAWNLFVTGYIRTDELTQKTPNQDYGIVIDKLTQELYLFKEGRLYSTLLISTGLYNDKQPYNETRSGEFFIVSRVGDFKSDNMICAKALRFNSGDLLHEVPHVLNGDGTKNYKNTEYKLGTRASHGCIRTQRARNAEGINMAWLWDNIKVGTKMVIWEDYAGRFMDPPDSSIPLYYNPDGGVNYHADINCSGVRSSYLPLAGSFTYGELTDPKYVEFTACPYCMPPRHLLVIEEINRIHQTESPGQVPQHLRQDK